MKLVLVEWLDSHGVLPSWVELTDFTAVLPIIKSVGWLVYENDVLLSVCGNIAEETDSTAFQGNGIMPIPKKAVLAIKELSA